MLRHAPCACDHPRTCSSSTMGTISQTLDVVPSMENSALRVVMCDEIRAV